MCKKAFSMFDKDGALTAARCRTAALGAFLASALAARSVSPKYYGLIFSYNTIVMFDVKPGRV